MALKPIDRWANEGPEFNRPVAEAVYSTVMKMDADEAVMFTRIVADAVLEDDLMVHGELIAKTLADDAAQRAEILKRNLARTAVAKGRRGENADTELAALSELSKSFVGDLFSHDKRAERARKQQRGVGSGRFVRQHNDIAHTGVPHSDVHGTRLGIPTAPEEYTPEQRAAYQQAYHQVSEIIKPYQRLPEGTAFVHLIDNAGKENIHKIPGRDGRLAPELFSAADGRKIVRTRVSVLPPADERGAIFNAFDTFGMPNVGAVMAGATDGGALDPNTVINFTTDIRKPTDEHVPSQKVFRRLGASADLINNTLGNVAPPHAKMALGVAQHVGRLGPAAQTLLGPTLDRAAYRYRGTDRDVDPRLQMAMEDDARTASRKAFAGADANRVIRESEARRDSHLNRNALLERQKGNLVRADWAQAGDDHKAGMISRSQLKDHTRRAQRELKRLQAERVANDTMAHKEHTATVKGAEKSITAGQSEKAAFTTRVMSHGFDGADQRWKQSQVIGYMRTRVPSADLHELHLKAGTVPPSEGFILDSKGKVVNQSVGYADDHYLPFNLKGMRKMRGGSYIRTRTWGGPTAEDIRTSLIGGAKSLTVVSNNGVFNIDFDDDFKGGRRHNDKAHRMIGRYEHLLDAVRNGKVTRTPIDPSRMEVIEREAAQRVNPQYNQKGYTDEVKRRVAEERKNPTLAPAQRDEAASEFLRGLASEHGHSDVDSLVDDIATRRARATIISGRQKVETWNRENPTRPMPLPTESLEVVKQGELDRLRSDSPQVQAASLASAFGRSKELDAVYSTAEQANRDNIRELTLNGPGYEAAMDALKQQFPFYIKSTSFKRFDNTPQRADTGYVRPGATRPQAAQAGMYDALWGSANQKVAADTVRGQGANVVQRATQKATQAATQTSEEPVAGVAATADAAKASDLPAVELQKQVNRAMLRSLLNQSEFPAGATLRIKGEDQPVGGLNLRGESGEPSYPKELKPFFARTVDEDKLFAELDDDPRGLAEKLKDAVRWMDNNNGHPDGDADYNKALRDFKSGGKVAAAADTQDTGDILDRPEREYNWAHQQGDAYSPGVPSTADEVANAYLRDGLVGEHVKRGDLPATVDDPAFTAKAKELTKQLQRQDAAIATWKRGGSFGSPPVGEAEHNAQVRGLVHAYTLNRRHGDAVVADSARSAARAEDFRHEEAMAAAHIPPIEMPLAGWSDEALKRLLDVNDPMADEYADNLEKNGMAREARAFRANVAERRRQAVEPFPAAASNRVLDDNPGLRSAALRAADDREVRNAQRAREQFGR